MPKRYGSTYFQIKNSRAKKQRSGFSLFSKNKNYKRRVRSESDRANSYLFSNPARNHRQINIVPNISKKSLVRLAVVCIVGAWLSLMLYHPYFNIKNIRITGLKTIKYDEIRPLIDEYLSKQRFALFNNNNYFTFFDKDLASVLSNHFFVEDIQISKTFPNQINVDIQEKISSIIYDNGQEYVILDKNGTVVKQLKTCSDECVVNATPTSSPSYYYSPSSTTSTLNTTTPPPTTNHIPKYDSFALEYLNIPLVYDERHQIVPIGAKFILLPKNIDKIETINSYVRRNSKRYNLKYFVLEGAGSGLKAITDKGFGIYFNLDNDLAGQFNYVEVVLKNNHPTEYIDVRYPNRVFWK